MSKVHGKRRDVYQEVTDKVCELLEAGTVPWRKPWVGSGGGFPQSLSTGRPYRGINVFMLECESWSRGFESPWWVTFRQAKERGGSVRKGEKGSMVTFWKQWTITDRDAQTGKPEKKTIPLLKHFHVFNAEQTEGVEYPKADTGERFDWSPMEQAESMVSSWDNGPEIRHEGGRAFYRPSTDVVTMPERDRFAKREEYYSTLFHELTHATGHENRLNRLTRGAGFGSGDYSKEELVAEMGAAFLCRHAGIVQATIDNSAAYVAGWLKQLRSDKKLVVSAAGAAQKAADMILGSDPPEADKSASG